MCDLQARCVNDQCGCRGVDIVDSAESGDPGWREVHAELVPLHKRKSSTYGVASEPFLNFIEVGLAQNQPPERYVWERILEKAIRALNMIDAGQAADVKEAPDCASLSICAEALRRRRT